MAAGANTQTSPVHMLMASPISSLLQEAFANTNQPNWKYKLPPVDKVQQIKQLIITFHTCKTYVDSNSLWELGEDLYVIRLDNLYPNVYITKCTLQQAIHWNISQIPLLPYFASSLSDIDKETLRINTMFTLFPEVAPFIFELQIDDNIRHASSHRAYSSQRKMTNMFLQHAPLIPKSTHNSLMEYLTVLNGRDSHTDSPKTEASLKVLTFLYTVYSS